MDLPGKSTGVGCHCLLLIFPRNHIIIFLFGGSLVTQSVKSLPAMRDTSVQSLGWEGLLEKEMTTHSNILAWKILWTDELGRLQSLGTQRVGHHWATSLSLPIGPYSTTSRITPSQNHPGSHIVSPTEATHSCSSRVDSRWEKYIDIHKVISKVKSF